MRATGKRWRYLVQATGLVWRSARPWTLLQGVLVVAQGLLPVAALYLTRQVVDAVGQFLAQAPGDKNPGALLALAPWVGGVVVAGWVLRAGSGIVAEAQAEAAFARPADEAVHGAAILEADEQAFAEARHQIALDLGAA